MPGIHQIDRKRFETPNKFLQLLYMDKSITLDALSVKLGIPISRLRNEIRKAKFIYRKNERDPEIIKAEKILYGD